MRACSKKLRAISPDAIVGAAGSRLFYPADGSSKEETWTQKPVMANDEDQEAYG